MISKRLFIKSKSPSLIFIIPIFSDITFSQALSYLFCIKEIFWVKISIAFCSFLSINGISVSANLAKFHDKIKG